MTQASDDDIHVRFDALGDAIRELCSDLAERTLESDARLTTRAECRQLLTDERIAHEATRRERDDWWSAGNAERKLTLYERDRADRAEAKLAELLARVRDAERGYSSQNALGALVLRGAIPEAFSDTASGPEGGDDGK